MYFFLSRVALNKSETVSWFMRACTSSLYKFIGMYQVFGSEILNENGTIYWVNSKKNMQTEPNLNYD